MKLKTLNNIVIFLLIAGMTGISSCGKKKLENATTSAEDNNVAEAMYEDVFNQSSSANSDADDTLGTMKTGSTNSLTAFTDTCATVTWTTTTDSSYVNSVTIDYGTTGCAFNGRTRKGKILITRNGKWFTVGTSTTIKLENFSIDGYAVEGTKTITTKTATTLQFLTSPYITASFDVVVTGGKVTTPDGEVLTWESTRNHTWTWEPLLNFYLRVTGSASGINRDGVNYLISITKTLVAKVGCTNIIEGTLEITSDDVNKKITIDYGDGTCDDKATITIGNKKTKELVLK